MTVINNQFEIGQAVYLKTDDDQRKRLVIAYLVYKEGELMYKLICGIIVSDHYEFEISVEKDLISA